MMKDFVGKLSYEQVSVFNATGRLPSRELADWIEAVRICLSWPDPRIWCNHIGALGGSARASTLASTASGILATDSKMYGIKPIIGGVSFIRDAKTLVEEGKEISEVLEVLSLWQGGKPKMMGYARPIAKGDERIPAMERTRKNLGLEMGPCLKLAFEIDRHMQAKYDESMNINGYVAAFLSDHDFTGEEVYRIYVTAVASGVTACCIDAYDKPAGNFLPLKCDDVLYAGEKFRVVPN